MTALVEKNLLQPVHIDPDARQHPKRRARPTARHNAHEASRALFGRANHGIDLSARYLVAAFIAELTDPGSPVARHYRDLANSHLLDDLLNSAARFGVGGGQRESTQVSAAEQADWWQASRDIRNELGRPLTAVLEHAYFLVLHPGDARQKVLAGLAAAGWARPQIVTWSQLIAFVGFQVRAEAGFTLQAVRL